MAWWSCTANKSASLTATQLAKLAKQSRFTATEVKSQYKEFQTMTKTASLSLAQYCEKVELLGVEPDLGQRLFSVMSKSGDSVTFEEYLCCMDIITNGTEDEQAELSFKLISKGNPITYTQFADMMRSMRKLVSIGDSEGNAKLIFAQLDTDHGKSIDLHEYKLGWRTNPQLFRWFELLTSRLTGKRGGDSGKDDFLKRLVDVERDVRDCMSLLVDAEQWKDEVEGLTPDLSDSEEACETSLDELTVLPACALLGQHPVLLASQRANGDEQTATPLLTTKLQTILFKLHELKALLKGERLPTEVRRAPSTLPSTSSTAISWCDENWNLAINALQGIHKAVKMTAESDCQPSEVSIVEQKRRHVIIPLSLGAEAGKVYKFTDYAPVALERVRQLFGLSCSDYLGALGVDRVLEHWMEGSFLSLEGLRVNEGREGFAYFSEDGKYVLRTTAKEEFQLIRRRLKDYFQYITIFPNSLLPRIYGLHKLIYKKKGHLTKMFLVSASNLLSKAYEKATVYSITGSKHVEPDIEAQLEDFCMSLGAARKRQFLSILEQDCRFLQSRNLTGYRLKVGVHAVEGQWQERSGARMQFVPFAEMNAGGLLAETGGRLYVLGLEEVWREDKSRPKGQKYAERLLTRVKAAIA